MKKRLFISSILMTLVLLVAVTTATFAWYKASNGSAQKQTTTATLNAKSETFSVGDILLEAEIKSISGNPTLTNASGKTFYYVGTHLVGPVDVAAADQTKTFQVDLHAYELVACSAEELAAAPVEGTKYYAKPDSTWIFKDMAGKSTVTAGEATHKAVEITSNASKLAAADGTYKVDLSGTQIKMGVDAATAVAVESANTYTINFNITLGVFKLYASSTESAWSAQTVHFGLIGTGSDGILTDESSFNTTLSAVVGTR